MYRRHHEWCQRRGNKFPALHADLEMSSQQRLSRRRTQTNDHFGANHFDLGFEPGLACCNLERVRFLVDAALASRLPFEMFHRVRDIDFLPIDAGFFQGFVENSSRRSDEWTPLKVFLIPWLFTDKHHACLRTSLTENSLCTQLPKVTGAPTFSCFPGLFDICNLYELRVHPPRPLTP